MTDGPTSAASEVYARIVSSGIPPEAVMAWGEGPVRVEFMHAYREGVLRALDRTTWTFERYAGEYARRIHVYPADDGTMPEAPADVETETNP